MLVLDVLYHGSSGGDAHSSSGGARIGLIVVNSEDAALNDENDSVLHKYLERDSEFGATYAIGMFGGACEQMQAIAVEVGRLQCTLLACEQMYDDERGVPGDPAVRFPSYIFFIGGCSDFCRNGDSPINF